MLRAWQPVHPGRRYLIGLIRYLPRKNGWTLAEHAGDATPDRTGAAAQPRRGITTRRRVIRRFVVEQLGDQPLRVAAWTSPDRRNRASTPLGPSGSTILAGGHCSAQRNGGVFGPAQPRQATQSGPGRRQSSAAGALPPGGPMVVGWPLPVRPIVGSDQRRQPEPVARSRM